MITISSQSVTTMTSKFEGSVKRAMASWQQALSDPGAQAGADRISLSIQRRELLDKVLTETRVSSEKQQGKDYDAVTTCVRPHHYEDFLSRMRTYKSSTWFAKPSSISATYCSRFGWVNVSSDRLKCLSCQSTLSHCHHDASGDLLRGRLQSSHLPICPWANLSSPASFLSPPHSECMDSVLKEFGQLFRSNWRCLLSLSSLSSPTSSSSSPLTWTMLAESLTVCRERDGKDPLNVTALLTGGRLSNDTKDGSTADNNHSHSVALVENIFQHLGKANDVERVHRDQVLQAWREGEDRDTSGYMSAASPLVAFCMAAQCSLLGLKLMVAEGARALTAATIVSPGADGGTDTVFTLSLVCPLCQVSVKHTCSTTSTAPLQLSRCHRNFCPHITGYSPRPEREGEEGGLGTAAATYVPVPAGWVLTLECLLAVSLGVEVAEELLGKENMYFCLPDPYKQKQRRSMEGNGSSEAKKRASFSSSHSSSPVAAGCGVAGTTSTPSPMRGAVAQQVTSHISESNYVDEDVETPFNIYKKIKFMLDS